MWAGLEECSKLKMFWKWMICWIVWCVHSRESVLLVFLVSGHCKLMRTVGVWRWEGPVILAAVDGGGRGWLFLNAIEEKASSVLQEVFFSECPMGYAGFGERLLFKFSQVVGHLRYEWNHAKEGLRTPSLGVHRQGTCGRWEGHVGGGTSIGEVLLSLRQCQSFLVCVHSNLDLK